MSERDFSIGSKSFKLNKIDAFKQFHIVRRMAPLLGELLPAMAAMSKAKNLDEMSEEEKLVQFAKIGEPLMVGLANMSDADADKVLFGLLASVEMKQDATGNWAKLATDSALMFSDLELPVMLQAAGRALMFNLSGFFNALPRNS